MKYLKTFEALNGEPVQISPENLEKVREMIQTAKNKIESFRKKGDKRAISETETELLNGLNKYNYNWEKDPHALELLGHYLDVN